MRIFAVNPNSFGTESFKKVEQMREAYQKYSFDIYLFSLPDRKWTVILEAKIRRKLQIDNWRLIWIIFCLTGIKKQREDSMWLPGGILSLFNGK